MSRTSEVVTVCLDGRHPVAREPHRGAVRKGAASVETAKSGRCQLCCVPALKLSKLPNIGKPHTPSLPDRVKTASSEDTGD